MKNILVVIPMSDRQKSYLQSKYPEANYIYSLPKTVSAEEVAEADYIIGNAPASMVAENNKLEWMQLNSAGADKYIAESVIRNGAILTNATGAYGLAVAEHMFTMTLMLMKKMNLYHRNQLDKCWHSEGSVTSFYGARTLVVGLGDIGCEYAMRAKMMGSYVVGLKRRSSEKPECVDELYTIDHLDDELSKADVVALFLPGTDDTYHIIGDHELSLMKDSAIIVNGGRGTAIETDALTQALNDRTLYGAAIDVTEPEPLPAEHLLWDATNILITPHISGQFNLDETVERIIRIAGENLEAMRNGEPLKNVVDFETGYKK